MAILDTSVHHLGSDLLRAAEGQEQGLSLASCGIPLVDKVALDGGFRYGELSSVAGYASSSKGLLVYHAAANQLIENSGAEVVFIDSTNAFSAERLRDVLAIHLISKQKKLQQSGYIYRSAKESPNEAGAKSEATEMLSRVKLMSVFNISGMSEAIGEVGEALERLKKASLFQAPVVDGEEWTEDDVLDHPRQDSTETSRKKSHPFAAGVTMLVIDNIADVVSPIMAKDYAQGNVSKLLSIAFAHHSKDRP